MQTCNLTQGTPEWHAHRAAHFNASDAPAMLGCSPYMTRAQLLRRMHTGVAAEVDPATQRRFDGGHRDEARSMPIREAIIGDDLAPVVGTLGKLSASFDGLTMMADEASEHKQLNAEIRAALPHEGRDSHARNDAAQLPKHYRVQMEQQLHVCGGRRVLFSATAWSDDGELIEERHAWYYPDAELRAEILRGWEQFEKDLAAYEPTAAAPAAVAAPMESLPAVQVALGGSLTVTSNLDEFGLALRGFIAKIPAQPTSDQEFADCEAACKALKRAEEALEAEEARALAGMADVEKMRRIVADLASLARTTRLQREKLVKARKDQLRAEQVQRGRAALAAHLQGLNRALGGGFMPDVPADFAGVIAGKKTMVSIADAIDTELARAKIAANEIAQGIQANLNTLREHEEHRHLFPDVSAIVQKKPEDLKALVAARIAGHRAAEEKRLEAERARIRAEEEARAQRQQQERAAAEHRTQQAMEAAAVHVAVLPQTAAPTSTPAATVVPMPTRAPAAATPPTLKLGELNTRIAPLSIDAAGLASLGFPFAATDKSARLWHEHQFPAICDALIAQIARAKLQRAA